MVSADGPRSTTSRRGPRAVLLVSLLFGLAYLAFTLARRPERLALDFEVYHGAARALRDGGAVYGVPFGRASYLVYAYPPVTTLAFLPTFPVYALLLAYPLVPMVYRFEGRARRWAVGGGLLLALSLRLDDLRVLAAPLGGTGESVVALLTPAFTPVTPPLLGLAALFVACGFVVGD